MTTEICVPNPFALWFHEFIAQPYHEGVRRIKRAILGVDLAFIDRPSLSCQERVISFLVGSALLLLPFVNTIIWVAMRIFGNADVLADPFPRSSPPLALPAPSKPPALKKVKFSVVLPRAKAASAPNLTNKPSNIQHFRYKDAPKEGPSLELDWMHKLYPHQSILTEKNPSNPHRRSKLVFDSEWNQLFFRRTEADGKTTFTVKRKGNTLVALKTVADEGKLQTFLLEKPLPWVQSLTFGFSRFVKACAEEYDRYRESQASQPRDSLVAFTKEFPFYTIDPSDQKLKEAVLSFREICHLEGHGRVLRFESSFCGGALSYLQKYFAAARGSHWFYPDGRLAKMEFPAPASITSELIVT